MNKIYNYFLIHYSPVQPLPQNSTLYSFYYQRIHSYEVRKSLTIACTPEFRYFSCTFFHFCYESKARNLRASSFTYVFSISLIFKCLFHSQAVFFFNFMSFRSTWVRIADPYFSTSKSRNISLSYSPSFSRITF